jgi:ATP/maltotriose-dependent transcriptional regulator MalT
MQRLNLVTESALTLVSAPAGFGKTTLLAECWQRLPTNAPRRGSRSTSATTIPD